MFLGTEGKLLLLGVGGGGNYFWGPKNNIMYIKKTFLFVLHGMSNRDTLCTTNNTLIKNESND